MILLLMILKSYLIVILILLLLANLLFQPLLIDNVDPDALTDTYLPSDTDFQPNQLLFLYANTGTKNKPVWSNDFVSSDVEYNRLYVLAVVNSEKDSPIDYNYPFEAIFLPFIHLILILIEIIVFL